jgi:hypothetical protein
MGEVGRLVSIQQGDVHILSVGAGGVRPAAVSIAHVDFPTEVYAGETAFTPSGETQTVHVNGKVCTSDITIGPVPQGWGRISWDGSVLTVS